jgi:hypothetical protein
LEQSSRHRIKNKNQLRDRADVLILFKTTGLFPIFWEQAHLPTDHCEDGIGIEAATSVMMLQWLYCVVMFYDATSMSAMNV